MNTVKIYGCVLPFLPVEDKKVTWPVVRARNHGVVLPEGGEAGLDGGLEQSVSHMVGLDDPLGSIPAGDGFQNFPTF